MPEDSNTRSGQREIQWPHSHDLDSFGTQTSYVTTPLPTKMRMIKPSSLVMRLYISCPGWNFATPIIHFQLARSECDYSRAGVAAVTPASAQIRVLWVSFRKMLPMMNVKPATIIG